MSGPIALRSSGRALPVLDCVDVRDDVAVDDTEAVFEAVFDGDAVAEDDDVLVAAAVTVDENEAPALADGDADDEIDAVREMLGVVVLLLVGDDVDDGVADCLTGTTNTAWNMLLAGAVASRVYPDPAVVESSCVVS